MTLRDPKSQPQPAAQMHFVIRETRPEDFDQWLPLWESYNQFYKRTVPLEVTRLTWTRFHNAQESMFALVAEENGRLIGFTHFLYHRSTSLENNICYLQDLFTIDATRNKGVGRQLIEAVYERAKKAGLARVYWQTHESNEIAQHLYRKIADRSGFLVYRKVL